MKESVQIKAVLFEGCHDALLGFYERYNRLFVNKLLLKLCEGIMPDYKPTLALFDQNSDVGKVKGRKVSILIEKKSSPLMYAFYCGLPYGSRTMVIVNLMNSYVQLAEADAKLMERLYWEDSLPTASPIAQEINGPTLATPSLAPASPGLAGESDKSDTEGPDHSSKSVRDSTMNAEPEPQPDPLSTFDTGL